MTLVHNMDIPSSTSTEKPLSQSIVSNNNKKKGSDTSSSKSKNGNSKKTTSSSKKSPTKKSPTKKSSTQRTTTKSSSASSKRPPPRPTSSRPSPSRPTSSKTSTRSSSSRTTSQSTPSRSTTKPSSSRPSSSSSSHRSTNSSKSSSSTKSQRTSSRPVHPTQRTTPQSKSSQSTVHKKSTSQKMKSVHQNQSRTNVPKKSVQPKTSVGVKVHPSHSNSKVKKPSSDVYKSSKAARDTKGEHSPNISSEQLRERREALQNKKPKKPNTGKPEKSINDTRPPKHKSGTVPNRGSRYDSTMERGNTGNRITPSSSSKSKGGLTNSQRGNSRVDNQNVNDHRNDDYQDGFSTNRNTGPVVIVVEKPSSTPDGWNPEIHRQSSGEERHWHPNYWGAGVFYYTDPPQNVYVEEHNYYGDTVRKYEAPKRKCDRRKSLSVGLRGGTLGSQVEDFSQDDISWGGAVGYRLFDPIGLEVSYIKTGDEWTTGLKAPAQVSGNLYLFPWTGVSPYITGGISIAEQAGAKNQTDFELPDGYAYGPHGGVGIEWGIGNHISLNAEGRYTKFKNVDATHTQLSAGLNFYF